MVSNVCYFHPETWGRSHFDSYFSNGLKPPTSEGFGALGGFREFLADGKLGGAKNCSAKQTQIAQL